MLAAIDGQVGACRLLLDAGADPQIRGNDGNDALVLATAHGHDAVSALLVERSSTPVDTEVVRDKDAIDGVPSIDAGDDPMDSWEEELDHPAPVGNDGWMPLASAVQDHLSAHRPIDSSEDWSEVELPLFETLHLSRFTEESLARLRSLLREGIASGVLAASSIEELVSPDDGDEADAPPAHHVHLVVAELGILTEEIAEVPPVEDAASDDEMLDGEITSALSFLASLDSADHDPESLYAREARRLRRLGPAQEIAAASAMREAIEECLQAIARCPRALAAFSALPAATASAPPDVDNDEAGALPDPSAPGLDPAVPSPQGCEDAPVQAAGVRVDSFGQGPSVPIHRPAGLSLSELARFDDRTLWPLADADARDSFVQALGRALDARRQLVEGHLWLVSWMARHYLWSGLPFLDLFQEGCLGLISAAETFDPSRGNLLSTYAGWWIRAALTNAVPRLALTIRIPPRIFLLIRQVEQASGALSDELGRDPNVSEIAGRMQLPASKIHQLLTFGRQADLLAVVADEEPGDEPDRELEDAVTPTPETAVLVADRRRTVRRALARIKPRYREVIQQRYGLSGSREHTLEEIGRTMALTRERVRQIEADALAALRKVLRSMDTVRTTRRPPLVAR